MRPHSVCRAPGAVLCAAALGTVLGAAGCGDPATAPDDVDGLRAVASVQPAEVRVGRPVTITVTVTNAGPRTRRLVSACEDEFVLSDSSGAALPAVERICLLIPVLPVEVRPGQQVVLTRAWYGDVGTAPRRNGSGVAAPPGAYQLRAFVRSLGTPPKDGTVFSVRDLPTVYAEPVAVRVLP